ncbi:MAG TPA: methyltransferase domain-containing protein [Pyrinomonadaceae bacterium]
MLKTVKADCLWTEAITFTHGDDADLTTNDTVPALYDWLSRYVQLANWLSYRDRFASFTMHKTLSVPAETSEPQNRTAGLDYVNDQMLKAAQLPPAPRVLDAGCGFGGTIFHWHERIGGQYDGLTLSRVQLRVARREAERRGIADACRFHLQSYDAAIAGSYDAVTAIESLVHAPDLSQTIYNLARSLRPGGLMLILEDMAKVDIEREAPADAMLLRQHWGCHPYPTEDNYRQALERARLNVIHEADLTPHVRYRSADILDQQEKKYTRLYKLLRLAPARAVLSAYLGGVGLERLYQKGKMRYRLIVARRGHSES